MWCLFCFFCITFFCLLIVGIFPWIIPVLCYSWDTKREKKSIAKNIFFESTLIGAFLSSLALLPFYFSYWRQSWLLVMDTMRLDEFIVFIPFIYKLVIVFILLFNIYKMYKVVKRFF